jgi:hypothetical protein
MNVQILQALASNMEFMDEFKSSSLHFSKKKILFMHILHYNYKKNWVFSFSFFKGKLSKFGEYKKWNNNK